jgi:hypothetical protein
MNINYKESQFEFFPESSGAQDETKRSRFMAARFNMTIEFLVIFSIACIMVVVFSFSLGVERGKLVALRTVNPVIADDRLSEEIAIGVPKKVDAVPVLEAESFLKSDSLRADVIDAGNNRKKNVVAVVRDAIVANATLKTALPKSGAYTVQLASYKTEQSARREALTLEGKGYETFVLPKGEHVNSVCR